MADEETARQMGVRLCRAVAEAAGDNVMEDEGILASSIAIGMSVRLETAEARIAELERENAEMRVEAEHLRSVAWAENNVSAELRAWQERAWPVVERMARRAGAPVPLGGSGQLSEHIRCEECNRYVEPPRGHEPNCRAEQARALLAAERGEEAAE